MPTTGTTTINEAQTLRAKELDTEVREKKVAMHEAKKKAEDEIDLLRAELIRIQTACNHANYTVSHDEMDCKDCGATWGHGRGWYCDC